LPLDAIPGAQLIDSVPVPNLPIEMTISPSLGVEGGLTMQAGQLTLGLGTLHFQLETRTGIHYDPTGGWSTVSERTGPSFTYEPPGFQGNVDIQLSVTGGLYAAIDLGLAPIGLGDFLDVKLLQVKAREQVDATVPIEAVLFPPTPPETRYENPTWKRSTVGEATLQLAFEGSGGEVLQEVLESISKKIPTNLNLLPPTLYSVTRVQGETPRLTVSSSYSAAPPHTAITFDIRARPFGDTEAFVLGGSEVELWGSRDGGVAVLLGVTTLDTVGNASITHTFGIEGDYEVLAQVYDGLTGRIGLPVLTNSTTLTIDGDVPPFLLDPQPVVMEGQPGDTIVETVDLISGATAPFDFSITPTPSFQSISPLSGTVQPSASETITLTVKCPDPQTSVSTKSNQNPPVSVPLRIDPDHDDSIEVVIDCGGGGGGGGGGGAGGGGGGSSDGDPHLVTFDGIPYDFQAKGEAILARSTHSADNFQVQARQEAWNSRPVTVNTAAAMAVGLDRVAFYVWPPTTGSNDLLLVNGQPEAIALGATFHLADGGRITRDGRTYTVHWPVDRGHRVAVQDHRSYLNIAVQPSILLEDQVEGVLGNFDGDPSNDFRLRDGTLLPAPPSFEQLYGCPDGIACFAYDAEGWINRDAAESLFDYVPGDGPAHYAPAPGTTYPTVQQTSADFPADDQNAARAQCEAAGITHPVLLESCMLDLLICDDDPDCDGMGLNGRDDLPIHDLGTIGLHAVEWEFECLSSFPTCVDSFFIDDYGIAGSDGHTVRLDSPGLWGETLFRTPATKDLGQDVSQQTYLRLRLRIDADDPPGYPWQVPFRITLYTNDNQALQYETSRNILVFDQWIDIRMPLSGGEDDDGWDWTLTSTGGVLTNINWIEILVDPYENPPTRFHFDQIFFE
ncbi:MAG: VWD domain-containing protein, partial [Acidobacteriota bacterium]